MSEEWSAVANQICRLLHECRSPNWGGDGEEPIPVERLKRAERFARSIWDENSDTPIPWFSYGGDGGIHVAWADRFQRIDAEFFEDGGEELVAFAHRVNGKRSYTTRATEAQLRLLVVKSHWDLDETETSPDRKLAP